MSLTVTPTAWLSQRRRACWILAWLLAGLALMIAARATATGRLTISLGSIARGDWTAQGVRVSLTFGTAAQPGMIILQIKRLILPRHWGTARNLRVRCPDLRLDAALLRCEGARIQGILPQLGKQTFKANISYRPATGRLNINLYGLQIAGGQLDLSVQWSGGDWRITATAEGLSFAALTSLGVIPLPEGWTATGQLTINATLTGQGSELTTTVGELRFASLNFSDGTGLHAGQGLNGYLGWAIDLRGNGGFGQVEIRLESGQVYLDPVFTDFHVHPLTAEADVVLPGDSDTIRLMAFRVTQKGVFYAHGAMTLARSPFTLQALQLNPIKATFPQAYTTYIKPFLIGTVAARLETAGTLTGRLKLKDGKLRTVTLVLRDIHAVNNDGRFAIHQANGIIYWAAGNAPMPPESRLRWESGKLYGIAVGATRLTARLHGGDFRLTEPARLPLLDGALVIHRLVVQDAGSQHVTADLDAELKPISMQKLTKALGWPSFAGSLSGELPTLTYRNGTITLGGALRVNAFGGDIIIDDFTLREPLGPLPLLTADVAIRQLQLKTLTKAFSFGRITGHLNGNVDDLRLVGWKPAAFRAFFHTPKNGHAPHRISHQALKALSKLGSGGAGALLSQGLLWLFEDFSYARLGIGCVLKGNICVMRGIAPAENGYYIVLGSGLPHIDVIGHGRLVSWPTLMAQIKSVTTGGQPVVK